MPSNLDPGDRKLLLIAGAILLLLIIATAVLSPSQDETQGPGIPTTYSTAKNGAQAAYLLVGQLGYSTERWERSPLDLPANAAGTVLILAGPTNFPDKREREALMDFVRSGGWIIYAGNFPYLFLGTGMVAPPPFTHAASLESQTFPAIVPSPFTLAASKITMNARNRWADPDASEIPLYGELEKPVVVTWRVEKGRILWWAAPTPITNSGISQGENLAFFLNCIGAVRPDSIPRATTVLWDEYFHGYRGSLWDYFKETPVPWAVLQLALVTLFVLLAFGRRSGPLYAPAAVPRLSPLEFVDTLGDLYRRASAGSAAVRVAYQRFRMQLVRRLALAPSISNAQLETAVRERLSWRQPSLLDILQRAERATHEHDVAGPEALKILQALEHYEVLFGLKTRPNKETR